MRPRLLLAMDMYGNGRGIIRGILREARRRRWDCRVAGWGHQVRWEPSWLAGFTGIIAQARNAPQVEALRVAGRPTVNISNNDVGRALPTVVSDDRAVGALAAGHLLDRGYRILAAVGRYAAAFAQERLAGVGAAAASAGATFHELCGSAAQPLADHLAGFIAGLPRPVGIVAVNDYLAREVLEVCADAGIAVPDQAAVIGIDDDELVCETCEPELSSVALAGERIGRQAVELLAAQLDGGEVPMMTRLAPLGVIARRSTALAAVADPELAAALRCIEERACQGIDVDDVVAAVPLSRSALTRRFRDLLGTSIADQLRRRRLIEAKRLLADTRLPLGRVARRSGFSNAKQFGAAFGRETGSTPSAWRAQHARR